jgi:hypothetical protein
MKTLLLISGGMMIALLANAEDPPPRSTPIPTPRVIILYHEDLRINLENQRALTEKHFDAGKIDRQQYEKSMKEYKEGIEKYRSEGAAKSESKSDRTSKEKESSKK